MARLLTRLGAARFRPLVGKSCCHRGIVSPLAVRQWYHAALETRSAAPAVSTHFPTTIEGDNGPPHQLTPPGLGSQGPPSTRPGDWELTVGLEIHAQLHTDRKLFSPAATAPADAAPNSAVASFDLALPGAQPVLQRGVVLPALRAALALGCAIAPASAFDRKHYFYPDQPAGYQITQQRAPLARDGRVRLWPRDGLAPEEAVAGRAYVDVGIARVQLEQDTAKTLTDPRTGTTLLDFNRAGRALVEIVTRPEIRHARTAAACVRKVQRTLQAVGALAAGMEHGGLRADVNVSVRRRGGGGAVEGAEYGQRTEIKNLSSFRAVEQAIVAERDRQIGVLAAGGRVEGETRGWALGGAVTRRLRGKEGEVDYRYMPDPDLGPLRIAPSLVEHVRRLLPVLPDEQVRQLEALYGIQEKDASILVNLDEGERLEYFYEVVDDLVQNQRDDKQATEARGKLAFKWIVHEFGGLLTSYNRAFERNTVPAHSMSNVLQRLLQKQISRDGAKTVLALIIDDDRRPVDDIIESEGLLTPEAPDFDYEGSIKTLADENPQKVAKLRAGQKGIQQWFVGQLIRVGGKAVDPRTALKAVERFFGG